MLPKGGAVYHLWNVLVGGSSLHILGVLTWVYFVTITNYNVIFIPQFVMDSGKAVVK